MFGKKRVPKTSTQLSPHFLEIKDAIDPDHGGDPLGLVGKPTPSRNPRSEYVKAAKEGTLFGAVIGVGKIVPPGFVWPNRFYKSPASEREGTLLKEIVEKARSTGMDETPHISWLQNQLAEIEQETPFESEIPIQTEEQGASLMTLEGMFDATLIIASLCVGHRVATAMPKSMLQQWESELQANVEDRKMTRWEELGSLVSQRCGEFVQRGMSHDEILITLGIEPFLRLKWNPLLPSEVLMATWGYIQREGTKLAGQLEIPTAGTNKT